MKRSITLLILLCSFFAFGQYENDSIPTRGDIDSIGVSAFLDGVIEAYMNEKNIAGATMALVQGGEMKILKGYGFADLENKLPVDPEKTLFRIGSISKMFVWTAIMQLVEQGKISLDDDINTYFDDFKIPDTYSEPVTIKNLMTHTPGFEDLVIKLFVNNEDELLPLEDILSDQIPLRVRPPGTNASYSNHGTGMAALIVEKVSGMSFNDYVEENITGPLKMERTTFRQPLPDQLKADMSVGYYEEGGELKAGAFELVPLAPIGAASATAADMARFMMMNLQLGNLEEAVILDSITARLMQSPAHQHHPDVNPMRHGFMDVSQNGETIIGHGGDTFWFHSLMAIWPEHNMGLFLSFNSQGGGGTYIDVIEAFCDRYFLEQVQDLKPQSNEFLKRFKGTYEMNRYPHSDIFKISKMMGTATFSGTDDGLLKSEMGDDVQYYYHKEDLTFREVESSEVIVFKENESGAIKHIFIGGLPIFALDKVQGIDSPDMHIMILVMGGLVLVLSFIYWTITFFIKKRLHVTRVPGDTLPGMAKFFAWLAILVMLIFYLGVLMVFSNPFEVVFGIPVSLKVILVIPFITILLLVFMVIWILNIWKEGAVRLFSRLWYTLVWLCLIGLVWQLNYWNFLGWKF